MPNRALPLALGLLLAAPATTADSGPMVFDVRSHGAEPVPLHLRNAPTALMKEAGYGAGYRYAHDDPGAVEEMECLPPGLAAG